MNIKYVIDSPSDIIRFMNNILCYDNITLYKKVIADNNYTHVIRLGSYKSSGIDNVNVICSKHLIGAFKECMENNNFEFMKGKGNNNGRRK